MQPTSISVVIPCLNEARHLTHVLDALAAQSHRPDEIVLVDGGSTDGTLELARDWAGIHPALPVRFLHNPARHIPHALNAGIAAASGEVILRLDGHSVPAPNYIERCLCGLRESGAAMVGGALEVRPGAPGVWAEAIALAVTSPLGAGDAAYRVGAVSAQETDTVPFGCFPKSLWQKLGGYNEALLTNEDYEFAVRVRAAGGRIWFDPRIRFQYVARTTLTELARQYWRYGWWKAQMLRRFPKSLRWRQAVPIGWSALGVLVLIGAVLWPSIIWLALSLWALYGLALVAFTLRTAGARLSLWLPLLAAFLVIHFMWGWGVWAGWAWHQVRR